MNNIYKQNEKIERIKENKQDNKIILIFDKDDELIKNINLTKKLEKEIGKINEESKNIKKIYNNNSRKQENNLNENIKLINKI
jgi:hypothetical protein